MSQCIISGLSEKQVCYYYFNTLVKVIFGISTPLVRNGSKYLVSISGEFNLNDFSLI